MVLFTLPYPASRPSRLLFARRMTNLARQRIVGDLRLVLVLDSPISKPDSNLLNLDVLNSAVRDMVITMVAPTTYRYS